MARNKIVAAVVLPPAIFCSEEKGPLFDIRRGVAGFLHSLQLKGKMASRWIKPEIYPLLVPIAGVVGLCCTQLMRNITTNPEVRVNKENRAAGVLENFKEGERYKEHAFRKFVRGKSPEVMPNLNRFFSDRY